MSAIAFLFSLRMLQFWERFFKNEKLHGVPGSPVVKNPVLPLKGAWVRSLVGDLISCILCSQKKKKKAKKNYDLYSEVVHIWKETERNQSWVSILAAPACCLASQMVKKRPIGYWEHSWHFHCNDFLFLSVILQLWKCRCKTGEQDKAEMLLLVVAQALESESWV